MTSDVNLPSDENAAPIEESLRVLLESHDDSAIYAALNHPAISEPHVCALLERKDLSETLIEEIAKRKKWSASYRVRRAMAEHPHAPRLIAMRALRDLHLMDLVRISVAPACRVELRRLAEDRVLAQLAQLPLGQRLTLALRSSARVAAGIVAQGPPEAARRALENPHLTESQLLKTLSQDELTPPILGLITAHPKWVNFTNVCMALLRNPNLAPEHIPALSEKLKRSEIEDLLALRQLSKRARECLRSELSRRESPE